MARKTKTLVIPGVRTEAVGERDNGKTFLLTEMDADAADDWATRALFALMNAGAELPDGVTSAGMAGIAVAGLQAIQKLPHAAAKPLLAELLTCVKYQHSPSVPLQPIFERDMCQIEEMKTFWTLRMSVLELHTGFSLAAALPT